MKTLMESLAEVRRYRDETIQNHDFDIGGPAEVDIENFLEWWYARGGVLDSRLVGEDDNETTR